MKTIYLLLAAWSLFSYQLAHAEDIALKKEGRGKRIK